MSERRAIHDIELLELADGAEGDALMETIRAVDASIEAKPSGDFNKRLTGAAAVEVIDGGVSSTFKQRLRNRWQEESRPSISIDVSWLWRGAITAAACMLCVAAVLVAMIDRDDGRQFQITDVPNQLAALHSLHIHGKIHAPDPENPGSYSWQPTQTYAARPRMFWQHFANTAARGYHATDGEHYIRVDNVGLTADVGKDTTARAQWMVESFFNKVQSSLIGDRQFAVRKVSSETVDDKLIDVYERVVNHPDGRTTRHVIRLNPQTGIPTNVQLYEQIGNGEERLTAIYSSFVANAPPPSAFPIRPPTSANITVKQTHRGLDQQITARAPALGGELLVRFAFIIDQRALLTCWTYTGAPGEDEPALTATCGPPGAPDMQHQQLAAYVGPGGVWRWTLSMPRSPAASIPVVDYHYALADGSAGDGAVARPLQTDRLALDAMLVAAQMQSRPSLTDDTPMITVSSVRNHLAARK